MRDRHWDQLSALLGFKLHPDKTFTMAAAEQMGLLQHLQAITKVADVAGKEYSIEQVCEDSGWRLPHEVTGMELLRLGKSYITDAAFVACVLLFNYLRHRARAAPTQALDKMQREWESAEMQVLDYRETKTFVIKVEEQISQMLDDHIAMTQSMAFRCVCVAAGAVEEGREGGREGGGRREEGGAHAAVRG